MKTSTALLGCSLLANGLLALAVCSKLSLRSAAPSAPSPSIQTPASPAAAAGGGPEIWSSLQNPDLRTYRAQLEAAGFSPRLARALAAAELHRQFMARWTAVARKTDDYPFWEQLVRDPATSAELQRIFREEYETSRELLGPNPDGDAPALLHAQFPSLSEDKIARILSISQAYAGQRIDVFGSLAGGSMTTAMRDKLLALDHDQHAQLAQVLTPEELENYELRTSQLAGELRVKFSAFDGTDDEFRTVFRLQSNFADRLAPQYVPPTPEERDAREAAQKELSEQIHAALGDERFAQYQRSQDFNYQQTYRLVGRLDLPHSAADDVWAVQQDIQQRFPALRANRTLTPEARAQQLAAMADEAKTRITSILGERGFEAYKQYGGNWMQMLQRAPAAPPARTAR